MHTWTRNRWLSVAAAVGYALAVTTASLFHNHGVQDNDGCCGGRAFAHEGSADCHHGEPDEDSPRRHAPATPGQCPSDAGHCPVCHFLGHKPAPVAETVSVVSGTLVQEGSSPAPARIAVGVFAAWHSRAPPPFA